MYKVHSTAAMDFFLYKTGQPAISLFDLLWTILSGSNIVAFIYLTFVFVQTDNLKRKVLYRILAVMLLGVFVFNTTPRAFIHQFFSHHDTEDESPAVKHGPAFSVKHVHCGFLHIEPEPYEHTTIFYNAVVKEITWHFPIPVIPVISPLPYRTLPPRAPPVIGFV